MLNWLNKKKDKNKNLSEGSSEINLRVVGDRASGKTTYMASLARCGNANYSSFVQVIEPFNKDGENLFNLAQDILEQGLRLEPTRLNEHADATSLPNYALKIIIKKELGIKTSEMLLNCKDYSGEFFSDLLYQTGNSLLQDYIDDCLEAESILFLIDGIAYQKDREYAKGLGKFLDNFRTNTDKKKRRLALVLSKCEQPDLWINRHKPKDLVIARFPEVYRKLEAWQKSGYGKVEYFTSSAFGMLGTRFPEANAKKIRRGQDGVVSVLKDTQHWRPFGLVAPIYWLYTGERHQGLEKD